LQLAASIYRDELVERCLQGDTKAFSELYQRYCKAMFSTCYRIVNHVAEAEDVLQESFIDAFRNLAKFSNESTFGGWLKTIVINEKYQSFKKEKIRLNRY
jgi:RNA polymerase sigma factor (sigma-70 family)